MHKLSKQINYLLFIWLMYVLTGCANISAPTGGPKDETPPKAKFYYPENNSINFKENTFQIRFDEKIQDVDDPSQVIVNPILTKDLELRVKNKRTLVVKIKENLKENTTYTFNFRNAIKDLTEGNIPKEAIQYNFSTGPFLDSSRIFGNTIDLFKNKVNEKTIIAIYTLEDTIDITKHKPLYLTQVNKDGTYVINNIKSSIYRVVSFADNNNTALYDSEEKVIDFKDSVYIDGSQKIDFNLSKIKKEGFKILSQKPFTPYEYQITLTSGLAQLGQISDSNSKLWKRQLYPNAKIISIFNTHKIYGDSIDINFKGIDSLGFDTTLNTKIVFVNTPEKANNKSQKIKKELPRIIEPTDMTLKTDSQSILLGFAKPIAYFNSKNLKILFDSIGIVDNDEIKYNFLNDSTQLLIKTNIEFKDSINLNIDNQSFINIVGDTIAALKAKFLFNKNLETGVLAGEVVTDRSNIIIELLDEKYKVISRMEVNKSFIFKNIKAGKYLLRILFDDNGNGKWDQGNYKTFKKAEDIYYYNTQINLKADWEITDIVIKIEENHVD